MRRVSGQVWSQEPQHLRGSTPGYSMYARDKVSVVFVKGSGECGGQEGGAGRAEELWRTLCPVYAQMRWRQQRELCLRPRKRMLSFRERSYV